MSEFTLTSPPAGLNQPARDGWSSATTSAPELGDIWLLTWNGAPQGLILVPSVKPDYILGMPITLGSDLASDQEAILPHTVLGTESTLWFNAETGLGTFLLHRRILP